MTVLMLIVLLLALLLLMPLRLLVVYDEDGLNAEIGIGPFMLNPKEKKPGAEPKKKKAAEAKGGSTENWRSQWSSFAKLFRKLRSRIRARELTLYYRSAAKDPADAALQYGLASAAAAAIVNIIKNSFRIRKCDIRTGVSFTETAPTVFLRLRLYVPLIVLLITVLPVLLKGQKPDKAADGEEN